MPRYRVRARTIDDIEHTPARTRRSASIGSRYILARGAWATANGLAYSEAFDLSPVAPSFFNPYAVRSELTEFEDGRYWTPTTKQYGSSRKRVASVRARAVRRPTARGWRVDLSRLGFVDTRHTLVCVRRHRRREVLLALGRGGRTRRGRFNSNSKYWC